MAEISNPPANEEPQAPPADGAPKSQGQDINPWSVSGEVGEDGKVKAIDYRKLTTEFGTSLIDDALLVRWEQVTGTKPHRFMRRQIVFSHRDLNTILDRYEKVHLGACNRNQ
jgi:tryptophanyl-tRNA synthetase